MEKHVSMYKYFYIKKALAVSPTAATFYFYNFSSATFSGAFSATFSGTFSGTR
jgi:hypothetical protein